MSTDSPTDTPSPSLNDDRDFPPPTRVTSRALTSVVSATVPDTVLPVSCRSVPIIDTERVASTETS